MANDLYRGYEIEQGPDGLFAWADERGFIHNGKVDARGGYATADAAMDGIDAYKRAIRDAGK